MHVRLQGSTSQPLFQDLPADHAVTHQRTSEAPILLAAGGILCNCQVVDLQAPASDETRVFPRYQNQPAAPSLGQDRGALGDTVRLVPERTVERGTFADGGIDQIGAIGMIARKDIRFARHTKFRWGVGELGQDRLAANHHQILHIRDGPRGADSHAPIPRAS